MRILIIAVTAASLLCYIAASYFLLNQTGVYGPSLKILLSSYQSLMDHVSRRKAVDNPNAIADDVTDHSDETNGDGTLSFRSSYFVCNSPSTLFQLMETVLAGTSRSIDDIVKYGEDVVRVHETFVYDTRMQLNSFQGRLLVAKKEIQDTPGPAADVLQHIHDQLGTIYNDIFNITKHTALKMDYDNHGAANAIKSHAKQVMFENLDMFQTFDVSDMDVIGCVCDATEAADQLYSTQYPTLQWCLEEFDRAARDLFNNTRHNFDIMAYITIQDVVRSVDSKSMVDGILHLPVKVRITCGF